MSHLNMKCLLILIFSIGFLFNSASAQTPSADLKGKKLRDWLRVNYHDSGYLNLYYSKARRQLYNYIDNKGDKLTCVYSGYQKAWDYGGSGTNPTPINCEHTVPQSFFDGEEPMKSDLHHLFPAYMSWNSTRSNNPFAEIDDKKAEKWMREKKSQTNPPSLNREEYSKFKEGFFEPRDAHKGNVARAVFYFYTMYPTEAGNMSRVGDMEMFYKWHLLDPVDADERSRNDKIEKYQKNRNPYIDHPEWIARAWDLKEEIKPEVTTPRPRPMVFRGRPNLSGKGVLLSKYVEGSSYNKAIEITNMTSATIDLSNYTICKQSNGAGGWSKGIALKGELREGESFLVAHSKAASDLQAKADFTTGSSEMGFNGNDAIGLFKNGQLLDIIGVLDGGAEYFAKDITLIRKKHIHKPNKRYTSSEWKSENVNTF